MDDTKAELNCEQINLQNSRVATANLMKYIAENKDDIISIQEPYIHQGIAEGIDTKYKILTAGETRSRRDVIITNTNVDATVTSLLSDKSTIT